jgi:4-aminobutyrate aminotransferase-like enzyme
MGDHMLASAYRASLAHRLADLTPGDLQYTTFGAAGGEAIDFAIKLTRGFTGRAGIVSAVKGYHGHTGMARLPQQMTTAIAGARSLLDSSASHSATSMQPIAR